VAARKVLGYILAGKRAWGITFPRDEKTLYVANNGLGDDVSIIDTASRWRTLGTSRSSSLRHHRR
jgi:DNA-binding beta-propeller fold protein YncE